MAATTNPNVVPDGGETVNGERYFGPVEKRGGNWGWFEVTANTRVPRFIAYGHIHTKREANQARNIAIAKEKGTI